MSAPARGKEDEGEASEAPEAPETTEPASREQADEKKATAAMLSGESERAMSDAARERSSKVRGRVGWDMDGAEDGTT
jgi:hypothetical protein